MNKELLELCKEMAQWWKEELYDDEMTATTIAEIYGPKTANLVERFIAAVEEASAE